MASLPGAENSGIGDQSEALPHCDHDEYSYLSDACDANAGEASRLVHEQLANHVLFLPGVSDLKKTTTKKENSHMSVLGQYSSFSGNKMAENTSCSNASLRSLRLHKNHPESVFLTRHVRNLASSLHAYSHHPSDQWQPNLHEIRRDG